MAWAGEKLKRGILPSERTRLAPGGRGGPDRWLPQHHHRSGRVRTQSSAATTDGYYRLMGRRWGSWSYRADIRPGTPGYAGRNPG